MELTRILLAMTAVCCWGFASAQLSDLKLSGLIRVQVDTDSVEVEVSAIKNREQSGKSGSLKLAVYATKEPYKSGTISGTKIYESRIEQLRAGYTRNIKLKGAMLKKPMEGRYYVTVLLLEYDGKDERYYIVANETIAHMIDFNFRTQDSYNRFIESHDLVVVAFYTTWCGPCKNLDEIIERIERKYGDKVKILPVDADEYHDLSKWQKVSHVPTYRVYRAGKLSWEKKGPGTFEDLEKELDR